MFIRSFAVFLSVVSICIHVELWAQTANAIHYPRLIHADVPLYPPIPATMRFGGIVKIQVVVENGIVSDAKVIYETIEPMVNSQNVSSNKDENKKLLPYLANPSLENLKSWKFYPEERTTFIVTYIYRMEGEETLLPENPKVEFNLPYLIKVTRKPFKPTQT